MNLDWMKLTASQRSAVSLLCEQGPSGLPRDLGEQLLSLGLAEWADGVYCISALGTTMRPSAAH
ncbi:hypothetical protein [Devosia sp. LjRoot3]|uniref:hypothetical protein n=1 Tax=Devosia sp. LjRoot3 TaxID=3342319 RepID=UPI003ECD2683